MPARLTPHLEHRRPLRPPTPRSPRACARSLEGMFPVTHSDAPLFSSTAVTHGETCVDGDLTLPLAIETPAAAWSYAVWFARADDPPTGAVMVRLSLRVARGQVGVGLLNIAMDAYLDEVIIAAGPDIQRAEVAALEASQIGFLMVRNTSGDGASRAELLGIDWFDVEIAKVVERPLSRPGPMAEWNRYFDNRGLTTMERLRAARFDRFHEPTVLSWSDGTSFLLTPGDQMSRAVYVLGTYEPDTLRVLQAVLGTGDVFVDIGANVGLITLAAAQWVGPRGRVYAFEPSAREFLRLTDTIERNHLGQVEAVATAVGAAAGTASLRVADDGHGGLNTLASEFPYPGIETARIETVPVVTLDAFVARHDIGRIAAIKIDVEGSEAAILHGATQVVSRDRPVLVVEVLSRALSRAGTDVATLERWFAAQDYIVYAITEDGPLRGVESLSVCDGQNVVAMPRRGRDSMHELGTHLERDEE